MSRLPFVLRELSRLAILAAAIGLAVTFIWSR